MNFQITDNIHTISSISRKGTNGDYLLDWNSTGLQKFLVLVGKKECDVLLNDNNEKLKDYISENINIILEKEEINIPENNISAFIVDFSTLKRCGGYNVKGRPGTYAVYGIDEDEMVVYIPQINNTFQIKIDIAIKDIPLKEEKGLFKKTQVYTGFHKVIIERGVSNIEKGALFYKVMGSDYRYPIPQEIIANGGTFFVKCTENEQIEFGTTDREGIKII